MLKRKVFSLFAIIILLYGCSSEKNVNVSSFEPVGEVDRLTKFTVEFDENLAPPEKQNIWMDEEFIEFSPEIIGKFKWTDARTLIFSPDVPLEPIQEYEAKITSKVLFNKNIGIDREEYKFNTPDFDVLKSEFFWNHLQGKDYILGVQANIYFNYEVVPDLLKKYLEVQIAGKEITDYMIVSEQAGKVIAINFGEISQTKKEQDLSIKIKNGLESVIGKKALEEDRDFEYTLPPLKRLAITGVSAGFNGSDGWIDVSTTQMVDLKNISQYVSTDPSVRLTFAVNNNNFRIEGNFEGLNEVEIRVKKGLPGLYGGKLEYDFVQLVSMVNLKPAINYTDKNGKYLMYSGEKNLEVSSVNVKEMELEVIQVFENNLIHFLDNNRWNYFPGNWNPSYYSGNYGRTILEGKINKTNGESKNRIEKTLVNLNDILGGKYKGVYVVRVRSSEQRWIQDSKIVAVTDLGIIAKKWGRGIMVFINNIRNAMPVAGAEIKIISDNNQVIAEGLTDNEGILKIGSLRDEFKDFSPSMVIASKGEDFNYLFLSKTRLETSRYDVGGLTRHSDEFKAFLYSERNIYRPGESMNLSGILRNNRNKLIDKMPVFIKIFSPTGKIFGKYKQTLNEESSFELNIDLPDYSQTGKYIVNLYVGDDNLTGSYSFSIEEFVPDKIRVILNPEKSNYMPGEISKTKIKGEFLFGAPAAGMKYESELMLREVPFRSRKLPKYNFSNYSGNNSFIDKQRVEGILDGEGKGDIIYRLPQNPAKGGIFRAVIFSSVFDLTGRTVNQTAEFKLWPQDYFIGIRSDGYYYGTNSNIALSFAAVDKNDNILKDFKGEIILIKKEWHSVLKKDYSNQYYYVSEVKEVEQWKKNLTLHGETNYSLNVAQSGSYSIRIRKEGDEVYWEKEFYAYGWSSSGDASFAVNKEGRIEIVTDKTSYESGEKAKVLFTTPFDGKMLVSFEREEVIDYRYVDVVNNSAEIEMPMNEDFLPNIYINATLFRPHEGGNNSPILVGHGIKSVKVEKRINRINLEITAEAKMKPEMKHKIKLKAGAEKDIFVTIAAVDEGILQIKDFATPNPYDYMYAKNALGVDSYDLYELLLPEFSAKTSSTGGDGLMAKMKKRQNPVKSKRFKLVSHWSGILKTNASGEAETEFFIPRFNGELRIMAVAYKGERFGAAEKSVKVSDDLIIEPQIPRFLTMGDTLVIPVSLINTSKNKGDVSIDLSVSGPIEILSSGPGNKEIKPGNMETVEFMITATGMGQGKIIFNTDGLGEIKEVIDIGVRPASPFVTETGNGKITAGEKFTLDMKNNFMEGTESGKIVLSKFPAIGLTDQLNTLVKYPYGCIEQTVSKLFPQLYFQELVLAAAPELYRRHNPIYYVKEGIRKIEDMQLYDGSISYWQGGSYSNWWGSVYAAHFLIEAEKAGFSVNSDVIKNLLNYIKKRSGEKEIYTYRYYRNNSEKVVNIARKEIIYGLYVLALSGRAELPLMNYYRSRPHLLSDDMVYLLAGAFRLAGNMDAFNELLPDNFTPEKTARETGRSFDSGMRANALKLNILIENDPDNPQVPVIIKYLTKNLKNCYSTQERAFTYLALGKASKRAAATDMKIDVLVDGEKTATFSGQNLTISDKSLAGAEVVFEPEGTGEVYYYYEMEGIPSQFRTEEADNDLRVRRKYFDYLSGSEITTNQFEQGELIVCKISLYSPSFNVDNIVISDLVPAGFEIENPRLKTSVENDWKIDKPLNVEYMDVRDDRMLLFTSLRAKREVEFIYMLRVVNKGKFILPPVNAEAMYDPEIQSVNGGGIVKIK